MELMLKNTILVVNTGDLSSRNFLTTIPSHAYNPQEMVIIDYYRNDPSDIQALDDLRSIGINFSSFPSAVLRTAPSPETGKCELAIVSGFTTYEEMENSRWTAFCQFLVQDVHPESDKVRIFQDSMAMDDRIPAAAMPGILACRTIVQLNGMYRKLVKEGILNLESQKVTEDIGEGVIIKLSKPELVVVNA